MAGVDPTQAAAEAQKTIADLGLVETNENTRLGESEADLKFNIGQQEAARQEREPEAYRTQQNAAVAHGIATTGMASLAHGNLVNRFAAQRAGNEARLSEGLSGINRQREGVKLKTTLGIQGAKETEAARDADYNASNPPVPQYPTPPAQQQAINSGVPAGPGGVVPYESQKVRVGPAKVRK